MPSPTKSASSKERYAAYLRSPTWERKRDAVLQRARFRCEQCGMPGQLSVHHIRYRRWGTEPLEELQALCQDCHDAKHSG